MRRLGCILWLAAMSGCSFIARARPTTVVVEPTVITETPPPPSTTSVTVGDKNDDLDPASVDRILVLQSRQLPRPAQVVGIVDAHEPTGSEPLALLVLRRNAARLGADAVVGVEFHHAESPGEPLHLSGLAVRFIEWR